MTDSQIISGTQDGAVEFKMVAVFPKFDWHPFFCDQNLTPCPQSCLPRDRRITPSKAFDKMMISLINLTLVVHLENYSNRDFEKNER